MIKSDMYTHIDGENVKSRISIAVFQNFRNYLIFSKRNEPTLQFEIYAEYSAIIEEETQGRYQEITLTSFSKEK